MFHVRVGSTNMVTVYAITINTSASSPIHRRHRSGRVHYLIEKLPYISDGDDDIG